MGAPDPATTRVLVTGANGFAGSHLTRALLEKGYTVRGLVRRPHALPEDLRTRIEIAVGDVRDARAVAQAVEGCQVVYHQAGLYRDSSAPDHAYWDTNVGGTMNVLAACERHRVQRLVHCSTMGVHGSVTQVPSDETSPFNPSDPYQRSKVAGEERVWTWYRRTQIPTTVIRPAGMYGPGDLRFRKLFKSIQGGYFVMLGPGTINFHLVYIEDLIRGYLLLGTRPEAIGEAFLITGDEYVTLNELVLLISRILEVSPPRWRAPVWPFYAAGAVCEAICVPLHIKPPLHRRRVGFFTHNRAFTNAKARRLLGFQPKVDLGEGFSRTAAWYEAQGFLRPVHAHSKGNGKVAA